MSEFEWKFLNFILQIFIMGSLFGYIMAHVVEWVIGLILKRDRARR